VLSKNVGRGSWKKIEIKEEIGLERGEKKTALRGKNRN